MEATKSKVLEAAYNNTSEYFADSITQHGMKGQELFISCEVSLTKTFNFCYSINYVNFI